MVVNLTKTDVVVFNERVGCSHARPFVFNDDGVPDSKHYNYLGVTSYNGVNRFGDKSKSNYDKALRVIYASRNPARDIIGPDIHIIVLCKIFDTQLQPISDDGSEVS